MSHVAMNIGAAAQAAGISAKMVRYYEEIGLMPKVPRSEGGYRTYSANDVHTLRFIRQARNLGFSLQQVAELLNLWHDKNRSSSKVKALALAHIADLDKRIRELNAMKDALSNLATHCHGDDRCECPILDSIASHLGNRA